MGLKTVSCKTLGMAIRCLPINNDSLLSIAEKVFYACYIVYGPIILMLSWTVMTKLSIVLYLLIVVFVVYVLLTYVLCNNKN